MSSSPDVWHDLSPSFGPVYWGFVISFVLSGITIAQAYVYFPAPRDGTIIRSMAVAMLVLDIVTSGLLAQAVYYYLIPRFGSLIPLEAVTPELTSECLMSAMMMFLSQLYFIRQLWIVKGLGTKWWVAVISFFAFAAFAGGVACVIVMFRYPYNVLANRSNYFAIFAGVAKGGGAITDILATTAMCLFLTSSRTGMAETNAMLTKLMTFIIHRGALVTLFQTALLIVFYAAPDRLYWAPIHLNSTKLYACTFFAMLNGRHHLKPKVAHGGDVSTFEASAPKSYASRYSSKFSNSVTDRFDPSVGTVSAA